MISKAIFLLKSAKRSGIHISVNKGELQLKLLKGNAIDPQLLQEIKENKEGIIDFLNNDKWKSARVDESEKPLKNYDRNSATPVPLSFSQERLWFIDQLEGSVQYHLPTVLKLTGKLNRQGLADALKGLVERHESLRSVIYEEQGGPYQRVMDAKEWNLSIVDGPAYKNDPAALQQYIQQVINAPFDLSKDYMLRASLVDLDTQDHLLIITMHHIASDGWSLPVIVKELVERYTSYVEDRPSRLEPLEIQYPDFAAWQRDYLQGAVLETKMGYWKKQLKAVPYLQLPTDFTRPMVQNTRGASAGFNISKELAEGFQLLCQQEGATLFMGLLAAFKVLLHRYSGQQDICVGTPIAGRRREELEGLIGFFVNTLALRTRVSDELSFTKLLAEVKLTTMDAYEHQDAPFEKVVDAVVKERDLGHSPLFQVIFVLQNAADTGELNLPELRLSREIPENNTSKFDISFFITETDNGFRGVVEYRTGLFKEQRIMRMIDHYKQLLQSIVKSSDQEIGLLPLITLAEEQQLLVDFNNTKQEYPIDKTLVDLFEEQVVNTPGSTALVFEDKQLSYAELNSKANQLARYLRAKGVKEETLVPICLERSLEMIVGILGILKAGGAYVPIDPAYPAERIKYMLEDTRATIMVSSKETALRLPVTDNKNLVEIDGHALLIAQQPADNLNLAITPGNLAYIIYTSGSTGTPKGVMVEQGNVVSLVRGIDYVQLTNLDILLSTGSSSFDATSFEYWGMLLNGGQLILCAENTLLNSTLLKELIQSKGVNKMWFTSSWFNQLVETDMAVFAGLKTILAGGEKLSEKHIQKIRQTHPAIEIINGYGPTENTTFSLTFKITDTILNTAIPVGRPLSNRSALIIDANGQLVPIGVAGEICLGGAGLARGYLNLADLTAEKFIKNPFVKEAGLRLYKTGDIGCWLPDGNIEYLGRMDEQVKIRGYRIEPGEIETTLLQSGLVSQAVVLAKQNAQGSKMLVGYVVAEGMFNKEAINSWLLDKLPAYMIPSIWVPLENLPLTPNGKIDRKSLPDHDSAEWVTNEYAAPVTGIEKAFVTIWQELLGRSQIGTGDNFFELGGDSILTIQVVSRARRLGFELQPKDLFIHQTIGRLSAAIAERSGAMVLGEQGILTGLSGLVPIQQWYFEMEQVDINHFNQAVLLGISKVITGHELAHAVEQLMEQHDALRFKYYKQDDQWQQEYGNYQGELITEDLQSIPLGLLGSAITEKATAHQRGLNITTGELLRVVWVQTPGSEANNRLLIVAHHLAIDGVSWRILLEDLELLLDGLKKGEKTKLGHKSSSYRQWYHALEHYGQSRRLLSQLNYWQQAVKTYQALPVDKNYNSPVKSKDIAQRVVRLGAEQTSRLLQEVPRVYHTEINDLLLAALALTISNWSGNETINIGLEGHGREEIELGIDTSRTIGWFTSLYPLLLVMPEVRQEADIIKSVKEQLRQLPGKGLGYGVLKYINKENSLAGVTEPWDIVFNYLGQLDNVVRESKWLSGAGESSGPGRSEEYIVSEKISINSSVLAGELLISWGYSSRHYDEATIQQLSAAYLTNLEQLIAHCMEQQKTVGTIFTPSDYGLGAEIGYEELDRFLMEPVNGRERRKSMEGLYRLQGLQQGMLFHSLYDEASGTYIEQLGCNLFGVNLEILNRSWAHLLKRHSILRSAFYFDVFSLPVQAVYKAVKLPVVLLDYRGLDAPGQASAIKEYEASDRATGFDFKLPPLMRLGLIRLSEDRYRMIWTSHHILFDGWSLAILMEEFLSTYELLNSGGELVTVEEDRYEDYIRYLEGIDPEQEEQYWRHYLQGIEQNTLLPFIGTTTERNKGAGIYQTLSIHLDTATTAELQGFAQGRRLTINTIMQGVWAYLLHHYTGNKNIVFGIVVSGRPEDLSGVEHRVGMYINTLPLHSIIHQDQGIAEWLQALQAEQVSSRQYQHTPLHRVQGWSGVQGDLFDTLFTFENYPVSKVIASKQWVLDVETVNIHEQTNYPLSLLINSSDQINISFSYNSELLDEAYVKEISGHFENVLLQLIKKGTGRVSDINLLTIVEQEQLLLEFNDTKTVRLYDKSIVELFEEQVSKTPDALALVFNEEKLSYRQLNERSNQLARYLKSRGVKAGTLVPICINPSLAMMEGILGILKTGGAYIPIDPDYPRERIAWMLEDTITSIVITNEANRLKLPVSASIDIIAIDGDSKTIDQYASDNLKEKIYPDQLAYIIYTSGSTGKPKGVMIEHGSLHNYLLNNKTNYIGSGANKAGSYIHLSYTFDASLTAMFMPLLYGRPVVVGSKQSVDVFEDSNLLQYAPYDFIKITPAHLELLQPKFKAFGKGLLAEKLVIGGEALRPSQFDMFIAEGIDVEVINEYGPTEATVGCTTYSFHTLADKNKIKDGISIGKPIGNSVIYILDERNALVPVGVKGEICIGGAGLASGYLNQPGMTAEKFIKNPFSSAPGDRLYKTGDIGRWLPGGNIEYLGRIDDQVKIGGYRVELGELETCILQSGLVRQAVVLAREDTPGVKRLVAYVVADGWNKDAISAYLHGKLPGYMVPGVWMELKNLPLTTNGKIDKRALPPPEMSEQLTNEFVAPGNKAEEEFAAIWKELLNVQRVGIHDNFFELGGDSILTIQVVSRARRLGYELKPKDIFTHQSIRRLTKAIEERSVAVILGEQGVLTGPGGLLPIQQWYFEMEQVDINHFNQAVLLGISKVITWHQLAHAVEQLMEQHDALRFKYYKHDDQWQQEYGNYTSELITEDLQSIPPGLLGSAITEKATAHQRSLNITTGELLRVVWMQTPGSEANNRLLIVAHHLAIDGVSWRILLEDLELLLDGLKKGEKTTLGHKSSSYRQWYHALENYGQSRRLLSQLNYWQQAVKTYQALPVDKNYNSPVKSKDIAQRVVRLGAEQTSRLLQEVPRVYHTEINDLLLAALALTISNWSGNETINIGLEGHGREEIEPGIDIGRTIGWFTSLYPLLLVMPEVKQEADIIKSVKEQLRQLPGKGLGYGVLKYINKENSLAGVTEPWDIVFNYLGQLDNVVRESKWLSGAGESSGPGRSEEYIVSEKISINSSVLAGELLISWGYSSKHYDEATIQQLSAAYLTNLEQLIAHCMEQQKTVGTIFTPSDYGLGTEIGYEELDRFLTEPLNDKTRKDSIAGLYRLSGLQQGLLFHSLYETGFDTYVHQFACDLTDTDLSLFRQSWNQVIRNHSILRSAFYYDVFAIPVQCVYNEVELPVEPLDLRNMDETEQAVALTGFEKADRYKSFDYKTAPLMRLTLVQVSENRFRMIWTWHHILFDGWSTPILMEEFLTVYESLVTGTGSLPVDEDRYEDYIRYIERGEKEQEENYWRNYLNGLEQTTLLPFIGSTRARTKGSDEYKILSLQLDTTVTTRAQRYAQSNHLTINTVIQGVWSFLLYQYTGSNNIVYGVIVSGRPDDLPGVERKVGLYINALPLHADIRDEKEITPWLQNLQAEQVASRQYQYTTLNDIQGWSGIPGDLFDTLVVFENYPLSKIITARQWSLQASDVHTHEQTNYPLTIIILANAAQISISFSYNTGLLEEAYVKEIRDHFEHVFLQVINNTNESFSDINLMTGLQKQRLLLDFNDTTVAWPVEKSIVDLFEEQVFKTPAAIALVFEDKEITYQQLNERSNQLAHYLTSQGVRQASLVPICIERGIEMLVGIFGILKAGAAYVPIDPEYPSDRISYMLEDAQAAFIITSKAASTKLPVTPDRGIVEIDTEWDSISKLPVENQPTKIQPAQLAYVIYTSGSTGKPKGVLVEHKGVVNLAFTQLGALQLEPEFSMLQFASFGFDAACYEIFLTLLNGGNLILAKKEDLLSAEVFEQLVNKHKVTLAGLPPSYLHIVKDALGTLSTILSVGEPLNVSIARHIQSKGIRLINGYGPTENTVCVSLSFDPVRENNIIVVGKPTANVQVYILDKKQHLSPIGSMGEIHVAGKQVARGYLNRPELTAEKFVANPFSGEAGSKMYKTGDLGRWLPDGNIEHLGRIDDQVKIRGYRVELGEIENVLVENGLVSQSVVLAKEDSHGDQQLVAYIVAANDLFDKQAVTSWLLNKLPGYMVPAVWVQMGSLPLTTNGKVDKKALPDPGVGGLLTNEYIAPRNEMEAALARIWQELLGKGQVGVYDNFFELGGHSLLAMRVVSAIRRELEVEMAISTFFELMTIEKIANYIKINREGFQLEFENFEEIKL